MADAMTQIQAARGVLVAPVRKAGALRLLGATALAATAAVLLAGVMALGPGVVIEDPGVAVVDPAG
jgi:hypothetical protein